MQKTWMRLTLFLSLFTFSPADITISHSPFPPPQPERKYDHTLSVVTYNIRGCRDDEGLADPAKIVQALKSLEADIIALQEVDNRLPRSQFVNQVAMIADSLRMNYAYAPSLDLLVGTYGNAVLSKYPILQAESLFLPATWEPRTLLDVTLDWNGSPLHVYATHLGAKKSEHKEQIESLRIYLQEKSDKTGILLGDFNMPSHDPLMGSLRRLYSDPLHERNHKLTTFTGSPVPKEIDRILLSRDLVYLHAQAPSIGPSDHYPVQMEIRKQFVDEKKALTLR